MFFLPIKRIKQKNESMLFMPELPEVETVRRAMAAHLIGRRIIRVQTSNKRLREPLPKPRLKALAGVSFTCAERRAKFLLLHLDDGQSLLVHLGMTGNLVFRQATEKHDHVIFELDGGLSLVYADPRRFGMVLVCSAAELAASPYLNRLGVEPLDDAFNLEFLWSHCKGRERPIKNMIMDSHVVVGVGNIYASEALFNAGIRPTVAAKRLSKVRLGRLVEAIKAVLRDAIQAGGTTISDYLGDGSGGRFQQSLAVYGRTGQGCLVCERPVQAMVMAGRSTFYCSGCQK